MTVTANTALRNQQVDNWGTDLSSGAIEIYGDDGSQPVDPDDPPTGTLLVSITLDASAYSAAASGSASTPTSISATAVATGTAAYARQRNAGSSRWQYGSVTVIGDGGDVQLDDLSIDTNDLVTISSSTISQAASA